jgi:hypothetical protein
MATIINQTENTNVAEIKRAKRDAIREAAKTAKAVAGDIADIEDAITETVEDTDLGKRVKAFKANLRVVDNGEICFIAITSTIIPASVCCYFVEGENHAIERRSFTYKGIKYERSEKDGKKSTPLSQDKKDFNDAVDSTGKVYCAEAEKVMKAVINTCSDWDTLYAVAIAQKKQQEAAMLEKYGFSAE